MRQVFPTRIWTIAGAIFMHSWAAIELFEWASLVTHSIRDSNYRLPIGLDPNSGLYHVVGLLAIIAVVSADTYVLATGFATSEDGKPTSDVASTRPEWNGAFSWTRMGTVLGLLALLVAAVFGLAGPAKVAVTAGIFAAVSVASVFLLLLRVEANSRMLAGIDAIGRHLNSADTHLRQIEAYRNRDSNPA